MDVSSSGDDEPAAGGDPRTRVLRAAMDIIVERGLDKVRLSEIGRRTNMSTGHVLYYFGTKDQILVETLQWSEAELTRRRRASLTDATPGWQQLRVFVEHYLPMNHGDPVWALWVEMLVRRHVAEHTAAVRATGAEWERDLARILRQGRRAGAFMGGGGSFASRLIALMDGLATQILQRSRERTSAIELVLKQCRIELR